MRQVTSAVFFIFCLIFSGVISCAADYSYDKFYKSDAAFKKADDHLNAIYKELQGSLAWGAGKSLLAEQRYWHDRLFPLLVEYADTAGKAGEAANSVLARRVRQLENLKKSPASDNILGMDITFGMTRQKVAEKLGIKDMNALAATPDNGRKAFELRLFGQNLPVYFNFMATVFAAAEPNDAPLLKKLTQAAARAFDTPEAEIAIKDQEFVLTTFVGLTTGELKSREDFLSLNESLSKKYKEAWPASKNNADSS